LMVARVSLGRVDEFIVYVLYHRQLPLTRVLIRGINNILKAEMEFRLGFFYSLTVGSSGIYWRQRFK
jgi:hypothetical protein